MNVKELYPANRANLTDRELDVWKGIAESETTKGIAITLGISPKTVEFHRAKLYRKVGVDNPAELTVLAVRTGLINA